MSNGNGVKSVSLADGTLSPDLRVNYTFGLVLGVNEFQQEQEYLLQKTYLYNRAFQGYGTVSGLHVTADWQKGEEVLITVSPGMAIDQFGMPIVVRDAQCARLTAWLKQQEAQQAGTMKKHRRKGEKWERLWKMGKKRDLRVYIIARYDDYADGQVPIAGQACSTSDTQPIYSRVHDSYTIDFSWDPPSLPAWESVRCFSKLMAQVRIKEDTDRNDTDEIIEQVLKLADPGSIPLCASRTETSKRDGEDEREDEDEEGREKHHYGDDDDDEQQPHWHIPTSSARESLDRIFRAWVMEVRPKLLPDLLDPSLAGTNSQPDILLAHIDFTLDDDWDDSDPRIEEHGFDPPDNGSRPFLLPTQVMQELLLIGQKESENIDGDDHGKQVHEFATIQVRNNHTLHAWVHHPRQLFIEGDEDDWGRMLEVRSNGQPLTITHVREVEQNYFEIEIVAEEEEQGSGMPMIPGARVELVFKVDEIRVERGAEDDEDEEEEHEELGDKVEDKLEEAGHEIKERAKEVGEEGEDFVKKAEGEIEKGVGGVVKDVGKVEKDFVRALERTIGIGKDLKEEGAKIEKEGRQVEGKGEQRVIDADADKARLAEKELAEDVKEKEEEERRRRQKLGRSIRRLGIEYVGYNHEEKVVIVYTIAAHIPVRELVTFFVYDQESNMPNMPHTELKKVTSAERFLALWFHTNDPVRLPPLVKIVRTFVNQQSQELVFRTVPPDKQMFSWFWALEPQAGDDEAKLVPGELLTVIFNTNEIGVGEEGAAMSLTDVMKDESFSCAGYDGDHTIEVHHQVSRGGSQRVGGESDTDKLPVDQPPAAPNNPPAPALPFVTVIHTGSNRSEEGPVEAHLELWFHLSANPYDNRTGFTDNLTFEALFEDGREMRIVRAEATRPRRGQHNVYTSTITLPPLEQEQGFYYLRLRFSLDTNEVSARSERIEYPTLRDYIRATGIRFEGYNGVDSILAYVRVFVPPPNTGRASRTAR